MALGQCPDSIDGAQVQMFAIRSGSDDFGFIEVDGGDDTPIRGVALAHYDENAGEYYKFSCDGFWETQGDFDFDSLEEAKEAAERDGVPSGRWRTPESKGALGGT